MVLYYSKMLPYYLNKKKHLIGNMLHSAFSNKKIPYVQCQTAYLFIQPISIDVNLTVPIDVIARG